MGFGGFYVVYAEGEWGFYNTPLNHGTVRILEAEQMLGAGGRSAHLQAPGRRIPGCLGTGCQRSPGRREGSSLPALCSRGLQMEQQKETTQLLLEQSSTSTTRGQSPAGAPRGALHMESSSQILPFQQLHYHKATKGLEGSWMGEKSHKLRGEKSLTAGKKT